MAVSNEVLTRYSVNRSLRKKGLIYIYNNGDYLEPVSNDADFIAAMEAGGIAISENLHRTQMYGVTGTPESRNPLNDGDPNSGFDYTTGDGQGGEAKPKDGVSLTKNEVYQLIPWLKRFAGADADKLVEAYINGYIESDGNVTVALNELRFGEGADAYSRVFAGIIDEDTGSLKMTETAYIAGLETTLTTLTEYNLGGYASAKGKEVWATLVQNNVSPEVYRSRVGVAYDLLKETDVDLKNSIINQYNEYFARETGQPVFMDDSSILALAIDPNASADIIQGRLNASELGAIYSGTVGEKIDLASIERYIGAGVTTQSANKTFLDASVTARLYGRLSRKYGRNTNLGKVSSMLESTLFGDELIEGQIKSIAAQALSESSPGIGAAQTQGGQVIGLTEN